MTESEFNDRFESWTKVPPLAWQSRLFHDHFLNNDLPRCIDLPTGLGKTMVMAIWLIAREAGKALPLEQQLPRRLVYVVDRRTVVDQATFEAIKLQKAVGEEQLAVSPLRGERADNRKWAEDPSRPAIIIGTVDLIGSALLFSGYRSGFKRRPLEAGLLGQDSLLVLDEAHLSKPFDKLITQIEQFQNGHGRPMKVIRMSATTAGDAANRFKLEDSDRKDKIISERVGAKKTLAIEPAVESKKLDAALANAAIELATDNSLIGRRIVVFVRSPEDAKDIAAIIRKHGSSKSANGPFAKCVEVLTGTMRGLERDELLDPENEKSKMKRFLDGDILPSHESNQDPVFLVSTSAGEVGFDLNADHMVCDAAPLDSMIQRLGRVNRRGLGDATVRLILEKEPRDKSKFDKACIEAARLFHDGMDVSPRALAELRMRLTGEQLKAASTPEPSMEELTDILLDAWSMTSIKDRMPGRPEVAPWLRGIADELPRTTIAWRAELDLFKDHPNPQKPLAAIFAKHRIRPHESLTTNSYRVVEFFKEITKKNNRPDLLDTRIVVKSSRDLEVTTIGKLLDNPNALNADPTVILPATFGGLDDGMLNHEAIPPVLQPDDAPPQSLDVADEPGYEPRENVSARLRILIERTDEGWSVAPVPGGGSIPEGLNLEPLYNTPALLRRAIAKTELRVRLVQPVAFDKEDAAVRSLVTLSPTGMRPTNEDQLLAVHVGAVETEALRIANELGLQGPVRTALLFAARWHDEGKKAAIWQRYVYGTDPDNPRGKAATTRDPRTLLGYRHEFGSLLRIHYPERHSTECTLPADCNTRDLALHLIATHHGFGRPHFKNPVDRDFKTKQCETLHTDAIRRFAELQRSYGHWQLAWLENLLRCADAQASADPDADDDDADESNEAGGPA